MSERNGFTAERAPGMAGRLWLIVFLCAPGLCGIFCAGCRSTDKPHSASFAAVEIHGNTPGQISSVAVAVFEAKGYTLAEPGLTRLTFEKKGSAMRNLAYGNWIGDTPVWIRVKAAIVPAGEATFRLECRAAMLRDRGEATEEEIPISKLNSGPYQKLLDEVARRFNSSPAP